MSFEPADLTEHLDSLYRYSLSVTRDPELAADTAAGRDRARCWRSAISTGANRRWGIG